MMVSLSLFRHAHILSQREWLRDLGLETADKANVNAAMRPGLFLFRLPACLCWVSKVEVDGGGGYVPVFVLWVWLCACVNNTWLFGNTHPGLQGNKRAVEKCYRPLFTEIKSVVERQKRKQTKHLTHVRNITEGGMIRLSIDLKRKRTILIVCFSQKALWSRPFPLASKGLIGPNVWILTAGNKKLEQVTLWFDKFYTLWHLSHFSMWLNTWLFSSLVK